MNGSSYDKISMLCFFTQRMYIEFLANENGVSVDLQLISQEVKILHVYTYCT